MNWFLFIIIGVLALGVVLSQNNAAFWKRKTEEVVVSNIEFLGLKSALQADLALKQGTIASLRQALRETLPVTVPKVATGLRQVTGDMQAIVQDPDGINEITPKQNRELQDRLNGYAAELEAVGKLII